jgi:hypothetical protein
MTRRVVLTFSEFIRLCEQLQQERHALLIERPLYRVAAKRLAAAAGLRPVAVSTLKAAMRATGVLWRSPLSRSWPGTEEVIKALQESHRQLAEQVVALKAGRVATLEAEVIALKQAKVVQMDTQQESPPFWWQKPRFSDN